MNEKNSFLINQLSFGFVTYKPSLNFKKRIDLLTKKNIKIYIFENSDAEFSYPKENVKILGKKDNLGLGVGLFLIAREAIKDKKKYLFYLDQDTAINDKLTETILFYQNFLEIKKEYLLVNLKQSITPIIQECVMPINSATLFNLINLKKIGFHSKKIFLDGLDNELALRARFFNYKLAKASSFNTIDHGIEQGGIEIPFIKKTHALLKPYPFLRFRNILIIQFKLLILSLKNKDFLFTLLTARFLIAFITLQLIVKLVLLVNNDIRDK